MGDIAECSFGEAARCRAEDSISLAVYSMYMGGSSSLTINSVPKLDSGCGRQVVGLGTTATGGWLPSLGTSLL